MPELTGRASCQQHGVGVGRARGMALLRAGVCCGTCSASNYLLGMTPLPYLPFLCGSMLGMSVWSVIYASLGGASRSLLEQGVEPQLLLAGTATFRYFPTPTSYAFSQTLRDMCPLFARQEPLPCLDGTPIPHAYRSHAMALIWRLGPVCHRWAFRLHTHSHTHSHMHSLFRRKVHEQAYDGCQTSWRLTDAGWLSRWWAQLSCGHVFLESGL